MEDWCFFEICSGNLWKFCTQQAPSSKGPRVGEVSPFSVWNLLLVKVSLVKKKSRLVSWLLPKAQPHLSPLRLLPAILTCWELSMWFMWLTQNSQRNCVKLGCKVASYRKLTLQCGRAGRAYIITPLNPPAVSCWGWILTMIFPFRYWGSILLGHPHISGVSDGNNIWSPINVYKCELICHETLHHPIPIPLAFLFTQ